MTSKHKKVTSCDDLETTKNATSYTCSNCNKIYNSRNGLWVHSKKCKNTEEKSQTSIIAQLMKQNDDFKNIIIEQNKLFVGQSMELQEQNKLFVGQSMEMQKQNQEMQKQILDICKNGIITNNTVNSNNKTFNLQVFLNEDCKDAMNINEFIDSIKFQLADLEHMGQVGYVEGISNIIIKNMKALDVTKRPVHCTDQKRETIYVKDGGVWEKDEDDNKKLRKMIKSVAFRNSKCISLFKEKYPDCNKSESRYSNTYNKIVLESMGGGSKCNDYDSENKIIKKITKVFTIDK
jgi:hypothetical protein